MRFDPSLRGQESPTLHDLLSVTVFKRDFAGIRFLSRKVAVTTLLSNHYLLLWMWRRGMEGAADTSVWVVNWAHKRRTIGVDTLLV